MIGEVSVKMNTVGENDKTHAKDEVLILGNEAAEENFLASKREVKVVRELNIVFGGAVAVSGGEALFTWRPKLTLSLADEDELESIAVELDCLLQAVKKDPSARQDVGRFLTSTSKRLDMSPKELLDIVKEVYTPRGVLKVAYAPYSTGRHRLGVAPQHVFSSFCKKKKRNDIYIYIYICMYILRERERKRER